MALLGVVLFLLIAPGHRDDHLVGDMHGSREITYSQTQHARSTPVAVKDTTVIKGERVSPRR